MHPRILYDETFAEDKVRYAQYETSTHKVQSELLKPDSNRLKELIELAKNKEIAKLVTKWGVCWAEYMSIDGYNTHELLRYEDFDENTEYRIEESPKFLGKSRLMMYGGNRLQKLKFDVDNGFNKGFQIKFGPKLPRDYYGNYDYSTYPGGYSPNVALFGDD